MADVYCYPDSYVLKNKLNIHDKEQLLMAESNLQPYGCTSSRSSLFMEILTLTIFAVSMGISFRICTLGLGKSGQ